MLAPPAVNLIAAELEMLRNVFGDNLERTLLALFARQHRGAAERHADEGDDVIAGRRLKLHRIKPTARTLQEQEVSAARCIKGVHRRPRLDCPNAGFGNLLLYAEGFLRITS